jgi:hypothetical protein
MADRISSCNRSVTWTSWWMNWPVERRWTDPEEVSRGVGVVIVVSEAFSMLVVAAQIAAPLLSS